IRLGDIEQWMRPDREGIFAKLRAERPVSFHEEPVPPPDLGFDFPQGPGFWALTRYAEVMQVSRDPDTFHSAPTSTVGDMPAEIADEDGKHRLTTGELGSFFLLLVVAGNETTRNAISHGMRALTDHPDQRKVWTSDLETVSPSAVEEIVRWATPVINFRRTAT